MITIRGQYMHLLERMAGVTPTNVVVKSLACSALILTNIDSLLVGLLSPNVGYRYTYWRGV